MLYQILQHFQETLDPIIYFILGPVDPHDGITTLSELIGLKRLALALDVTVIMGGSLPVGWWGAFHYGTRTITMLEDLPEPVFRSVLAHELGHANYGHRGPSHHDSEQERLADQFAARHLIEPEDFLRACSLHGLDGVDAMARDLNVMPWVVREYMRSKPGKEVAERCHGKVTHITGLVGPELLILGNNVLR